MKKEKITQEFRQDPFTSEWVLVSTGREKRVKTIIEPVTKTSDVSRLVNPFADIIKNATDKNTLLQVKDEDDVSQVIVVPNKYPLLKPIQSPVYDTEGPYHYVLGEGMHEVVIYRDFDTPIRSFSLKKLILVFQAFQLRSLALMKSKHIRYISIIHNHGMKAGATVAHPHSQIIASPIVPDGIERIVEGAHLYYQTHKRDLVQTIIDYEQETGSRVIYENEDFIAIAPYASKTAYEIEIFPKDVQAHFAYTKPSAMYHLAQIYKYILKAYYLQLGDIDYNMNIISAPTDGNIYKGFRWFIRFSPRIQFVGGYEVGTDTDICTISPELAAEVLR